MPKDLSINTISIQDIINTYKSYDVSEEVKESILYFISELTGLSVDTILGLL